jgi:type VI secretion system protein ImpL
MKLLASLPASFWQLLALCGAGFLALWWFVLGARQSARRRALRRRIAALDVAESPSELADLQGVRQTIALARQTLQRAPTRRACNDSLYLVPWLLFIGDAAANVPGLLAAAQGAAVPDGLDATGKAFWRWWFMDAMVAIETSPAIVDAPDSRPARSLWYQALMDLAQQRSRLPINGIVVCLDASSLLDDADAVQHAAARLRHLVDETADHLQLRLPVYLVVNGFERLPGYDAVCGALPLQVLAQALGHRFPLHTPADAQDGRLAELLRPLRRRLQGLRMALLRNEPAPAGRLAIHAFFESLNALQPGLRQVVNGVFDERQGERSLHWRGIYFTGVQPDIGGAFVSDLFRRFLPQDQPLAHR